MPAVYMMYIVQAIDKHTSHTVKSSIIQEQGRHLTYYIQYNQVFITNHYKSGNYYISVSVFGFVAERVQYPKP